MSRTGELLAVAVLALCCRQVRCEAPTSLGELSPVERQQADFYGAIAGDGPAPKVSWTLGVTTVELGGDIELTLTVLHSVNPPELRRPELAERPEWKAIFAGIREVPSAAPGEFRYRLKPRAVGEYELPLPKYRYYQPRAAEGRRFQVAFSEAPKLTVLPAAPVEVLRTSFPIDAPARFFDEEPHLSGSATAPPAVSWWTLLVASLLGVPVAVALWRRRNPDAARLARIRRAKSARAALDAIRRAERSPDSAAAIAAALQRYFSDRWHVPPSDRTPGEVTAALLANGLPTTMAAEAESIMVACDRSRFGGASGSDVSLGALAGRLIARWEETGV